ncbi:MAG: EMC3/TMCO1 family protein [Nitrososphaerales archaeon]
MIEVNPMHTLLVAFVAIMLNLISNLATRLLTDVDRARRIRAEVRAFRKELRQAILTKNKAKEEKLRKREKQMMSLEMKVNTERIKPMLLFWIPFIIIYYLLAIFVGGYNTVVALSPIPLIPVSLSPFILVQEVGLIWWYLISSLAFNGMITKLLGTGLD